MGKECTTGRVTIPTDVDVVPETLELVKRWGADAIRDCDGTDYPEELKKGDAKVYATCYTTRKDNVWAKVNPDEIEEQTFEQYLDTKGIPDPDLMIRTSGELRLSNYLLWQLAYTEFYFTDVPWPDFSKEELEKAIEQYNHRDRRYGGVKEEEEQNV